MAEAFRSCTLTRAQWTHEAHLIVGAWHVHHQGPVVALQTLRDDIRKLNEHLGTVNSATNGYHETITAAYVQLIDRFLAAFQADESLDRRVQHLLAGPLGEKSVLLKFWSRDALMSETARAVWVAPDIAPLEVPAEALALIER